LFQETESQIYYTVYPKFGGRAPDELSDEQLIQIGRLLGRIHRVGKGRVASQRIQLTPETYGRTNLEYLLSRDLIPDEVRAGYVEVLSAILLLAEQAFKGIGLQRIHGDCHLGNLLWIPDTGASAERETGSLAGKPYFLDFDDMINGPVVQDLWLLFPSRLSGDLFAAKREALLTGYEQMNNFERSELKCVEILRALRFVHFSSWIARRWDDPSFPMAFPQFGTEKYWMGQSLDLREQLGWIRQDLDYPDPAVFSGLNKNHSHGVAGTTSEQIRTNLVNDQSEDDDRGNR
jgi:Ser/Thr protein kinase RdoA (MazF antagonist)